MNWMLSLPSSARFLICKQPRPTADCLQKLHGLVECQQGGVIYGLGFRAFDQRRVRSAAHGHALL